METSSLIFKPNQQMGFYTGALLPLNGTGKAQMGTIFIYIFTEKSTSSYWYFLVIVWYIFNIEF